MSTSILAARSSSRSIQPKCPSEAGHTFLEFFAGIGLTHLGLKPLGWNCVYANDIKVKKKRMYESLFGTADYYHVEDVWNTKKILAGMPALRADLATASFPCVDLSLAGNLKGLDGEQSGAFYGFLKVLKALRRLDRLPRALLVENVPGFLSSHGGRFFRIALRSLSELGYRLDAFVVDAKYFVPQSRLRVFILGFLPEVLPASECDEAFHLEAPASLRPPKLLQALKESLPGDGWVPLPLPALPAEKRDLERFIDTDPAQHWWDENLVTKHLSEMHPSHLDLIEQLRSGPILRVGTVYRRVREGKSRSEVRADGIAGCLRTPRGGSSKQIVFAAGRGELRMRWMNPREYARLQGASDFPIDVERNDALFGFGDAVCVPVISWIAANVLSQLFPATLTSRKVREAAAN